MEVSSRQLVALGAPLIVTYLTWSAVSGEVRTAPQSSKTPPIATAAMSKRPQIEALARNPFAPETGVAAIDPLGDVTGANGDPEQGSAALKLDGTVVAGRWRMAIINGERVFEGQSYRGRLRLQKVASDAVTLVTPAGETVRLQLDIAPPQPAAKPTAKPGSKGSANQAPKSEAGTDGSSSGNASAAAAKPAVRGSETKPLPPGQHDGEAKGAEMSRPGGAALY